MRFCYLSQLAAATIRWFVPLALPARAVGVTRSLACRFTFVRNPWTRVLSAYDMMTKHFLRRRSGSKGKEMGEKCGLTLSSFTQDTNNMRKLCPREDCCTWIPPTVGFVPAFIDLHINDQAHCVFLSDGRSLVDFVGRTEHIDQVWRCCTHPSTTALSSVTDTSGLEETSSTLTVDKEGFPGCSWGFRRPCRMQPICGSLEARGPGSHAASAAALPVNAERCLTPEAACEAPSCSGTRRCH